MSFFLPWAVRFGRNFADWCRMTCRLRDMVETETGSRIPIWRTFVVPNRKKLYLSRGLSYNYEIWFADRNWHSKRSDVTRFETGNKFRRLLENRYNIIISADDGPIWTTCGSLMQSEMPSTVAWSKQKPEVEFQYGGRLFFQTGSSYISAMD